MFKLLVILSIIKLCFRVLLFVYFLRSFNKWKQAFKRYFVFIFLMFLIPEKIISTPLLYFLINTFAINLINLKVIIKGH